MLIIATYMRVSFIVVLALISLSTNVLGKSFIINGEDVVTHRPFFTYIEMFRLPGLSGSAYFGGGSLVSQRAIVTVAHNVAGFQSWRVGLGGIRIIDLRWFTVDTNHVHPGYNASSLANNIAVLRLATNIPPSNEILSVNMLPMGSAFPQAGVPGYALGFGFGATNVQPNIIQQARLTVISQDECGAAYPHLIQMGQLDNHFCAQNATRGSNICAGDQGGPFFSVETNMLLALQSFNRDADCGSTAAQPAGFIRLAPYGDFIRALF